MTYPIIIIGMHRSGTSMISRMLQSLGLFMGVYNDPNDEPYYFIGLNDWLLLQAGAAWDRPDSFSALLQHPRLRQMTVDYLASSINRRGILLYLGVKHYLRHRSLQHVPFAWGWKDPRNTFTLPLWLDVFPNARIIHIYRHGVDAADSLVKREQRILDSMSAYPRETLTRSVFSLMTKQSFWHVGRYLPSPVTLSLDASFALWQRYADTAFQHVQALDDRAYQIRYEDFLANPYENLREIADFCHLKANDPTIRELSHHVNNDRAYAYRQTPELTTFARSVATVLEERGYSA